MKKNPSTDHLEPVRVEARTISPPLTISEQARLALSIGAKMPAVRRPDAHDTAAWLEAKRQSAALMEKQTKQTLAVSPCTIEARTMGGVKVHVAEPPAQRDGRVYLYAHGGALIFGEHWLAMAATAKYAQRLGIKTVGVDYRTPPEFPFPAATEDCFAVYRELLRDHHPSSIVIGGTSAGGNLALVTALMARDRGLPCAAALVLMTPQVDLTEAGDSFQTNHTVDVFLKNGLAECNALYANGASLRDPYVSPLLANLEGLPPVFIQAGTRDLFLSSAVMLHRKLRRAGNPADLHVWEAMPHGAFSLIPGVPEDEEVDAEAKRFIDLHCRHRPV